MFCIKCGAKSADTAKFCNKCGNPMPKPQPRQNQPQPQPQQNYQSPPQPQQPQPQPQPQYQPQPQQYQSQPQMQESQPQDKPKGILQNVLTQAVGELNRRDTQQQNRQQYNNNYSHTGTCYHHPSQPAVAQCKECGKGICRDCYDSYGGGMGEGALCFDCTEAMVKQHAAEIEWLKNTVKGERIWMLVGAILGLILGIMIMSSGTGAPPIILVLTITAGASLGTIISYQRASGGYMWLIMIAVSPIISVYRFVKRTRQIKQCEEILASDAQILQEMRDYFEYTMVLEQSAGVDLATLASQGSELYNNTYAQSVLRNGEQQAQANLRQSAVQIAANGEIIRSFDKRIENGVAA